MPADPNTNPNDTAEQKLELTPEQQELVNKQIAARLTRQEKQLTDQFNASKVQLDEQMRELTEQIEALKTTKTPVTDSDKLDTEEAKKAQIKALIDAEVQKRTQTERKLTDTSAERDRLANELKETRKRQAITEAMTGHGFQKPTDILKLTYDMVEYDETSKNYLVKENGVTKENASLEPMTLTEFYAEYATKNPGYVSSDAKSGVGSTPGSKQPAGVVRSKADFKTREAKVKWMSEHSIQEWEDLPLN